MSPRFLLKTRLSGPAPKALVASVAVMAALAAYRFYSYWTTGFFVSDEYGYYYDALHGAIYSDRWFVGWLNIFLFRGLGVNGVDGYSYLLPVYIFVWATISLTVFYKLLKLLGFDEATVALSLVSSFILIAFVLLSLGFLTEPVGLSMCMLGIYFLARYMKSTSPRGIVGFPILSACFFGFAAGTREPYNAFLIAGAAVVLLLAYSKRRDAPRAGRLGPKPLLATSVVAFVLLGAFFLYVPTQAYTQQVAPISGQLAQTILTNPVTYGATATTTTVTSTISSVVTVNSTFTTTTSTVVTVSAVHGPSYPFYKRFVLTNTLLIFFGGIVLGWGPIAFAIGLAGFLFVLQLVRKREVTGGFLILTSLTALGSYLVVSFIYAPDPTYFSFDNYSTLIRFSDTALPAYFLTAPLVMARISKSRKRVLGLAAVCLIFLLVAIPVYETYASSNLSSLGGVNPFDLSFRTPGAAVRDYFDTQPSSGQYYVAGLPFGWVFTPGAQDLKSVSVFALVNGEQAPYLNYSGFVADHWSDFYIYSTTPGSPAQSLPSFLAQPLQNQVNATLPYTFSSSQQVDSGQGFVLLHVEVAWR